jgi:hypothetical protein
MDARYGIASPWRRKDEQEIRLLRGPCRGRMRLWATIVALYIYCGLDETHGGPQNTAVWV